VTRRVSYGHTYSVTSWGIVRQGIIPAAGSSGSSTRTPLLHDVKTVVLHAAYALDITHQPDMTHAGGSWHRASYEIIIKYDRLDAKASDMLLMPGVEDFVAPIIEGEIELQGITYSSMMARPLPHTFT
jgi:hypothetical protein